MCRTISITHTHVRRRTSARDVEFYVAFPRRIYLFKLLMLLSLLIRMIFTFNCTFRFLFNQPTHQTANYYLVLSNAIILSAYTRQTLVSCSTISPSPLTFCYCLFPSRVHLFILPKKPNKQKKVTSLPLSLPSHSQHLQERAGHATSVKLLALPCFSH
jgi:hypothetical protein